MSTPSAQYDNKIVNVKDLKEYDKYKDIASVSTTSPLTDATNARLQGLTIYGRSEVVDGEIKSVGEGWSAVDLGTLSWRRSTEYLTAIFYTPITGIKVNGNGITARFTKIANRKAYYFGKEANDNEYCFNPATEQIYIRCDTYTDPAAFKAAMSGVLLCYQLADPSQGNTIAVKTDDGSGIDGTMATFTTALPLRSVSDTVRDKLICTADAKQVETVCGKVRLADLTWSYSATRIAFDCQIADIIINNISQLICGKYPFGGYISSTSEVTYKPKGIYRQKDTKTIFIKDDDYTTVSDFVASLGDAELVYELATPVTTPLTSAEISAFRSLKTYDSTTNITISDSPDFELDYLKNTDNGQTVADIQTDLQGQIDGITVELTQAEYDALTIEEKINGTIYFITDAPSGITIDSELSATSTNAVQNRVITSQVNNILSILSETEILAQINDRIYQGTDLTVKFASEISASPYAGDPWVWIKARIQAENFAGIHVGDYIPFTTTNGVTLIAQIAGINTYKNYGDSPVGAHIDFICKELWPTRHPVNKVNYNNGTSAQSYPWLASDLYLYLNSLSGDVPNGTSLNPETVAVDYTADGVYYFLPTQLKNVIIEKKFLLPTRYSASGLLTDDNLWAWQNIGKLWLPDECEVYGMPVWGGKGGYSLGGSALQYPLFAGNMNRLKFRNGSRYHWWLLSPYSGNSTDWCYVDSYGYCDSYGGASNSSIAAPVCFRIG